MITHTSVLQETCVYQAEIGPLNDMDPFGDYGTLQLRLVRHMPVERGIPVVTEATPDVRRWSLVSLKHPTLSATELTEAQAQDLLVTFFMRAASS